jgi:hypothetical protein
MKGGEGCTFPRYPHATVKASLRTNPTMLEWAAAKVIKGWNVPAFKH